MSEVIGIASDHGGKELKHKLVEFLQSLGYQIHDYGVARNDSTSVDYPDYAAQLAGDVSRGKLQRGIAVCGTGIGMCIAANKFPNVRATSVWDEFTAKMVRAHNDSNILCLGERVLDPEKALAFTRIWLDTEFEGGRHQGRLDKIKSIEKSIDKK